MRELTAVDALLQLSIQQAYGSLAAMRAAQRAFINQNKENIPPRRNWDGA